MLVVLNDIFKQGCHKTIVNGPARVYWHVGEDLISILPEGFQQEFELIDPWSLGYSDISDARISHTLRMKLPTKPCFCGGDKLKSTHSFWCPKHPDYKE